MQINQMFEINMFLFFAFDEYNYFSVIPLLCLWCDGLIAPMMLANDAMIGDVAPLIDVMTASVGLT
jgi:hypothetical protein